MAIRRFFGIFSLVTMVLADAPMVLANAPQAQGQVDEDIICTSIAIIWEGTLEDRQQIEAVPVPESFRKLLYDDYYCTHLQLVHGSLIGWHLAFGTEHTTTAALEVLREYFTKGLPKSDVRLALSRDWREILRKPGDAKPEDDDHPQAEEMNEFLETLDRMADNYTHVARLYIFASEFYESQALLEQALVHLARSQAVTQFFQEQVAPRIDKRSRIFERYVAKHLPGTSRTDVSDNLTDDVVLRAAVLKARLSRSPEDIDAAQARLDSYYVPVYRDAADFATSYGVKRFCEYAQNANKEKIHAACHGGIRNFENGLWEFWLYQAQLDLLKVPAPRVYDLQGADDQSGSSFVKRDPGDTRVKARVEIDSEIDSVQYARELSRQYVNSEYSLDEDRPIAGLPFRVLDLGYMYAEFYARLSDLSEYWVKEPGGLQSKAYYLKLAMLELERLERYVPAARDPGRFRRIATRYLRYYDELKALPPSAFGSFVRQTVEPSNALYYRIVLDALDQIMTGGSGADKEAR